MMDHQFDIDLLEKLTEELTKEDPEKKTLVKMMERAGLEYSDDPIDRINQVLKKIDFYIEKDEQDEN